MIAASVIRYPAHDLVDLTRRPSMDAFAYCWGEMGEEERAEAVRRTRGFLRYMMEVVARRERLYGEDA